MQLHSSELKLVAIHGPKPYEFIGKLAMHGPKPYEFASCSAYVLHFWAIFKCQNRRIHFFAAPGNPVKETMVLLVIRYLNCHFWTIVRVFLRGAPDIRIGERLLYAKSDSRVGGRPPKVGSRKLRRPPPAP